MPDLLTLVVLSLFTYRVTRFVILDSLIDGTRDQFHLWLTNSESIAVWRFKLQELLACPYCISVWIAAAALAFWSLVVEHSWIGWAFLLWWPAIAGGSLIPYRYVDSE